MGVITYFLLAGYTPFDRDSQQEEMEAIIAGVRKHVALVLNPCLIGISKLELQIRACRVLGKRFRHGERVRTILSDD